MPTLSEARIAELLTPYLEAPLPMWTSSGTLCPSQLATTELYLRFSVYLDLLLRWNARTNLTAVRDPDMIVQRHFGESLFAARVLGQRLSKGSTVLDFGSGAGFPGLPIQILLPELQVTLGEAQGKKAAFLREAVRVLDVRAGVLAERIERLPHTLLFDAVIMRAVDNSAPARQEAVARIKVGGWHFELGAKGSGPIQEIALPRPGSGVLVIQQRIDR